MFADYQALVLQTYHDKKASNDLLLNLSHPTAARIKSECIRICENRYHPRDEMLLRSFFGSQPDATAYRHAVKNTDPDKFKPLVIYLRNNSRKTSEKNIELLAWLLDFKQRPYRPGESDLADQQPVTGSDSTLGNSIKGKEINLPQERTIELSGQKKTVKAVPAKTVIISFIILAGLGTFLLLPRRDTGCMFWTGDHYQSISCSEQKGNLAVYAMDTIKLKYFQKITMPDTITERSMGHIWYSKIDNVIEFYTASGFHPVHTERRLKPLTNLIREKYITNKKSLSAGNN